MAVLRVRFVRRIVTRETGSTVTTDDTWGDDVDGDRVCMTHMRFIPCRHDGPCEFSNSDDDVAHVRAYQQGDRDDD